MALDRLITLAASWSAFLGALFMARAIWTMNPGAIVKLSGTYLGHNRSQVQALIEQKADLAIGLSLVIAAFGLNLLAYILPNSHAVRLASYWQPLVGTTAACIVIGLILLCIRTGLVRLYSHTVERTQFAEQLPADLRDLHRGRLRRDRYQQIESEAADHFQLHRRPDESEGQFVMRIAQLLRIAQKRSAPTVGETEYIEAPEQADE